MTERPSDRDASPVAIVAGGTGGIGTAVCELLSTRGYHVVAASRGKTAGHSQAVSDKVDVVTCDVTSESGCRKLVRETLEGYGRLDGMVYAAIGYHQGTPETHDAATLQSVFAANVFGAHLLSSACFSLAMRECGGGSICFIGSTAGALALPNRSAYCASKAALTGLCRALAVDWAYADVRVNCVTAAYVATEFELAGAEAGDWGHTLGDIERRIPAQRLARPDEVAVAAAWLLGRESMYVSGCELLVDGGWSAWSGHGNLRARGADGKVTPGARTRADDSQ